MLKISDLQSQVALNRNYLCTLEDAVRDCKFMRCNLKPSALNRKERLESTERELQSLSKQIKQYAKLQRALKDEIAYRIRFDRVMRELKVREAQAKDEGFEIVVEDKCIFL